MAWRRQAGRKRAPDVGVLDLRLRPQDRTGGNGERITDIKFIVH